MAVRYVAGRALSFTAAFRGVAVLLGESNSRIHGLATLVAVAFGAYFELARAEWCALVFAIALVWCAEGMNTALEKLADAAVPQRHELVGKAKDVGAAAVLIASMAALTIAGVLFLPRWFAR